MWFKLAFLTWLTVLISLATGIPEILEDLSYSSSYESSWDLQEDCDCVSKVCPQVPANCAHGLVTAPGDLCGCCYVCGNEEWKYCDPDPTMYPEYFAYYLPWEKPPPKPMWDPQEYKFGRCGWGLQCRLREDLGPVNSLPVFVCTCQDEDIVCGSDGKTYENPCNLREEAVKKGAQVAMKQRSMCLGEPIIATPPQNVSVAEGSVILLSCEVNSNPPATITWTKNHNLMEYRGPNRRKAIHSRPGISIYTTTGWLKIYGARKNDIGTYRCVATNEYGAVSAASEVRTVSAGTGVATVNLDTL
ncbi:putative kazal-type serine protease inhibitor domain-containing protein 1-like [Apostichopus japonicus]|uniref:Putative kazal-type serine protease inhibitor domain-containing protein 1-like n=1 Tax=Stichopus japonicus TaxID=307972 RepID=A0A2G8KWI0_STIJA|nr:putative kazal-type serine protease inhibitor domain-containing protein 1-like [Apostichopus japonicus]